ncbi:MAG: hypothetical protein KIH06_00775 [Kiritimatiellae bacterium]|nr:hypothetical protein [Kiritimatiellia bacterium]
MIEDMELATVVRRALEESVTPAGRESPAAIMALAAQEAARRRRVRCWRRGAGLAAAVLAAILLLPSSRRLSRGAAGAGVEGVIAVLCEIDGLDLCGGPEASAGDRLLDWQDAPCRDLL